MSEFIPCGEGGCVMSAGHPGPHARITYSGDTAVSVHDHVATLRTEIARLTQERDRLRVALEVADDTMFSRWGNPYTTSKVGKQIRNALNDKKG